MRLIFSTDDYLNAILSDDYGHKLYDISTSGLDYSETTIFRHGPRGCKDMMAIIKWNPHQARYTMISFWGTEFQADTLFAEQSTSSYLFTGPDGWPYVWHFKDTDCVLQLGGLQIAKYNKRKLSSSHPPHLEIGPYMENIWDHIVVTFLYAERLRRERYVNQKETNIHITNTMIW
ncbi:hypothetical protein V8B97DRAFT_1514446 [Scleroderma yunnanense]